MDGAGTEEEREPEGLEYKHEEDMLLNTGHFVVDVEDFDGHDTGSSVLSAFQSTAIKENVEDALGAEDGFSLLKEEEEEDERYCTLQATGSTSRDSEALDSQFDLASVCGQLSGFNSDMEALTPLSVVDFAREPSDESWSHEECEGYYSDGIENEAKKKKSTDRSGMCTEKASSGIPGDVRKQDVCGPATHQSSKRASTSAAAQQSYRVSSVLESGSSPDGRKGRKLFLENPEILQPARKKSRTFYSADQLEELEKMFQEDRYPDSEKRKEIAAMIGVTPQRIMVWFQNRRAKWRKSEKLRVKGNKKYRRSPALSVPRGSDGYGVPPLSDNAHDSSDTLSVDTISGKYTSLFSGPPSPLTTSSSSGMGASCEAVPTKALPPFNFSSSGTEPFPSPPPIRRASLPLDLSFNNQAYIVPLMLDAHNSECSLSGQENGFKEAYAYSIQNQGLSSPVSCNYPEQLEAPGNLETAYCQYSSQAGIYQLPHYPQQHELSQFHHLPGHLASNVLPSVGLTPMTLPESQPAFLAAPAYSRVMTCGAAGATQDYAQNPVGGQFFLQQPSGNLAGIPAYQAAPWNDFYMQEAPISSQLCSQMPFSSTVGGQYFTDQICYTQPPCVPSCPCFLQVPNGTTLGYMPHTGKQKGVTPPDQSSYQNLQTETELTSFDEGEEAEYTNIQDENNNGCCTEEEN